MIYACDHCLYLFETEEEPDRCPDCGKTNIRPATELEEQEFHRYQAEFQAES